MVTKLLPKRHTRQFIDQLREFGEVHVPTMKDERAVVFAPLRDVKDVVLHYQTTIIPPKKYFYDPQQVILNFTPDGGYKLPDEAELNKKVVLFGVHSCDIAAIQILDMVFSGTFYDTFYFSRRKNTAIIGISCIPDAYCFCASMGADFVETGFDLFLTDIGANWFVRVGSALGDNIVRANEKMFSNTEPKDILAFKDHANHFKSLFKRELDLTALAPIIELEYENKVWEELGGKCLECGACSLICPTCYCHGMYDQLQLDGKGERVRHWDSCMLKDFAQVAGGHNFRDDRATRVKLRYFHKQKAFVEQYGKPSCVGCGRCIDACPAGIDLVEILNRLRGEERVTDTACKP
jgi:sulfhydrogenase subunit beta (sulfur reductase)